ncbi:MAG: hypothetical protein QOD68_2884, partial [Actinomycetota bacterium]|nr:hypothetical protein [Actinomycetota bacterium]
PALGRRNPLAPLLHQVADRLAEPDREDAGRDDRGRGLPGLPPRVAGPDNGPGRPTAPDDDPDFLRGLNRPRPPTRDDDV